ncbi:MAG: cytochrome-c peroxidase [Verrucomicrobia bacterium]|nr:cytochrome-c peroxidase [Verrucomicrobiota bacterium]
MKSSLSIAMSLAAVGLTASVLGADIKSKIPDLRETAKLLIDVMPSRMPGSENDTPAKIELGKKLYFDVRLSVNDSQSCNTCHRLDEKRGGVDNEPTSQGAHGQRGNRNSPTVLNAGFYIAQFWDGRAKDLVEQAKGPVLNPVEMAMPSEPEVVKKLSAIKEYQDLFAKAFPTETEKITYDNIARAIAAFERTLITYDRFNDFLKGDDKALTDKELEGLELFINTGCTTCHNGPAMGGGSFQKVGLINEYKTEDKGRYDVTKDEDDIGKFKVPSLRNIALTAPYFHHGRYKNLADVVKLMAYHQLDKRLTDAEADTLVAFLKTLTDKERVK